MTMVMPDMRNLSRLESLWPGRLQDAFESYAQSSDRADLALAAALVEVGVDLQGLGRETAGPAGLLLGDLCLARACRLLAHARDVVAQVAFARAIEGASAAAAAGKTRDVRQLLLAAMASS